MSVCAEAKYVATRTKLGIYLHVTEPIGEVQTSERGSLMQS